MSQNSDGGGVKLKLIEKFSLLVCTINSAWKESVFTHLTFKLINYLKREEEIGGRANGSFVLYAIELLNEWKKVEQKRGKSR